MSAAEQLVLSSPATPPPIKGKRKERAEELVVSQALATPSEPQADSTVALMIGLASNPNVDLEKLEKIIAMQERLLKGQAEAAFNAAFSEMQGDLPEIDKNGKIVNKGTLQSRYAKNEDIQLALRPILRQHGFGLRFKTEWPSKTQVRIIGILKHKQGHQETSEFLADADTSGAKNAIQALGSTISYGHRYTATDLLNLTSRERKDDDGQSAVARAEGSKKIAVPEGFDAWLDDMTSVADEGWDEFKAAWAKSKLSYRDHMQAQHADTGNKLKNRAKDVTAKRAAAETAAAKGAAQ